MRETLLADSAAALTATASQELLNCSKEQCGPQCGLAAACFLPVTCELFLCNLQRLVACLTLML